MSDGQARFAELLERSRTLPLSADGAIEAVIDACDDPRSSMADIAERIGAEPGLAAIILRQANSAHYGFGRRIESIPDAAVVLGLGTIRCLAIASAVLRLLAVDRDGLSPYRRELLTHSVATATIARSLARRQGTTHPEKAFLTGLIHELGTVILTREARGEYLHVLATCRKRRAGFAVVERELFGFDHAQLGASLAEAWQFPPPLCDAVLNQHSPAQARLERPLCETLHLADWLAAETRVGARPFDHPERPDAKAMASYGVTDETLPALVAEAREALGTMPALAA